MASPDHGPSHGTQQVAGSTNVEANSSPYRPIILLDHNGKRFILPFERCQTYSSLQELVQQIYATASAEIKAKVDAGLYDILTVDDAIILPGVWEDVIKKYLALPADQDTVCHVIKIRFSPDPAADDGILEAYDPVDTTDYPVGRPNITFDQDYGIEPPPPRGHWPGSDLSPSRPPSESSTQDESSDGSDSSTLTGDEDQDSVSSVPPPPRAVVPAVDDEGNSISCVVDTKRPTHRQGHMKLGKDDREDHPSPGISNTHVMKTESPLRILKALQVQSESRMVLEIHKLETPETSFAGSGVSIRWHHLHGNRLDYTQFKNTSLGIQGLSERIRLLLSKLFAKLEHDKLDAYSEGMFFKPSTVLRVDESDRDDAQSVIFACVPFFDIAAPTKPSSGKGDRLHPPRTLMQAYYPYEHVRDRDMEQAYKKVKGKSSNAIIHVPSLWILNIGSHTVVTCGYRPLAEDFVKSISVVKEDLRSLNLSTTASKADSATRMRSTNIRLTDWVGRTFIYTVEECRTYFQLEQRVRELRYLTQEARYENMDIFWTRVSGREKVSPFNWLDVIGTRGMVFIDLIVCNPGRSDASKDEGLEHKHAMMLLDKTVPPFFSWPDSDKDYSDTKDSSTPVLATQVRQQVPTPQAGSMPPSTEEKRSTHRMEAVEKIMLAEVLNPDEARNDVDRAFTSPKYYEALPESTLKPTQTRFSQLSDNIDSPGSGPPDALTWHQVVVQRQCLQLASHATTFVDAVEAGFKLFLADTDEACIMRKSFGAMNRIADVVQKVQKRGSLPNDPRSAQSDQDTTGTTDQGWYVRSAKAMPNSTQFIPSVGNDDFKASTLSCKKCRRNYRWDTQSAALEHLRRHYGDGATNDTSQDGSSVKIDGAVLKAWVRSSEQVAIEETLAAHLAILSKVNIQALKLLSSLRELAKGVQADDGEVMELYTFPHELLRTLRRLIVFYLAVERAVHVVEDSFDNVIHVDGQLLNAILQSLDKFTESVQSSALTARKDLCSMARSQDHSITKRLSLGPEYICAWFMRRLLVRPVDINSSMTVPDFYREYLSTIQFQANHRPGKRLLRSINLLKEELRAAIQVNVWQKNVINSYSSVLDDATYQNDIPSRHALFPYEKVLLDSCSDSLNDASDDLSELLRRCNPLAESTRQWSEINEEDHGKAIFVFTVITAIFLPLSFVTSYLGMNTSDIRDMTNKQGLFWEIAIPLTAVTMGTIVFIAYNGDDFRDGTLNLWRRLNGKQAIGVDAMGISAGQRKRAAHPPSMSSSLADYRSIADEAEYSPPRPVWNHSWSYPPPPPPPPPPQFTTYTDTVPIAMDFTEDMPTSHSTRPARHVPATESYAEIDYEYVVPPRRNGARRLSPVRHVRPRRASPDFRSMPTRRMSGVPDDPRAAPNIQKIHKRYVDADTLEHFNLPWEYDTRDPNYFVILRNLDPGDTATLFEHTKQIRSGRRIRGNRTHYTTMQAKNEYTWVKNKDRSHARHTRGGEEDGRSRRRGVRWDGEARSPPNPEEVEAIGARSRGNF